MENLKNIIRPKIETQCCLSQRCIDERTPFDEHGNETYSFGAPTQSVMEDDAIKKNNGKKK
ncbi:MAG: hypothetical protein R2779_07930 [Crocinitomicaceae bacterium]